MPECFSDYRSMFVSLPELIFSISNLTALKCSGVLSVQHVLVIPEGLIWDASMFYAFLGLQTIREELLECGFWSPRSTCWLYPTQQQSNYGMEPPQKLLNVAPSLH